MALTVTEANAVHRLLGWLFARPNGAGEFTSGDEAREAAELLAEHAYKTLMCGPTAEAVRSEWSDFLVPPAVVPAELVHAHPGELGYVTPCCRRNVVDLPRTDRLSRDPHGITCAGQ